MIVEFAIAKTGLAGETHYLSGKDTEEWRIELRDGLNDLSDAQLARLRSFPGLQWYLDTGAIAFREEPETAFGRLSELEQLYESQGYKAIADIALGYGIQKPTTGWKEAIPLIVEYEKEM